MEPSLNHEILRVVANSPLEQLADLFKILAYKVCEHRRMHRGFVPFEIFEWCMALGGVQTALEIVPFLDATDTQPVRFALKSRMKGEELSWEGMFQIPGANAVSNTGPRDLLNRVSKELYGEQGRVLLFDELVFAGIEAHNEPERLSSCWTAVFTLRIRDIKELKGKWGLFIDPESSEIVDHHRETLKWLLNWRKPEVVDLRLHRDSNWLEMCPTNETDPLSVYWSILRSGSDISRADVERRANELDKE